MRALFTLLVVLPSASVSQAQLYNLLEDNRRFSNSNSVNPSPSDISEPIFFGADFDYFRSTGLFSSVGQTSSFSDTGFAASGVAGAWSYYDPDIVGFENLGPSFSSSEFDVKFELLGESFVTVDFVLNDDFFAWSLQMAFGVEGSPSSIISGSFGAQGIETYRLEAGVYSLRIAASAGAVPTQTDFYQEFRGVGSYDLAVEIESVPAPGSAGLLGVAGFGLLRRRRA